MNMPFLYSKFAKYYDIIYSSKNYKAEAAFIKERVKKKNAKVLELACGTGNHTKYFENYGFNVLGIDISQDMLNIAQYKCKKSKFIYGDFNKYKTRTKYDVVTLLFTSINYCLDENSLMHLIDKIYGFLCKGGCFVFDLGLTKIKNKLEKEMFMENFISDKFDIARISQWNSLNRDQSIFKAAYTTIIKDNNGGILDFGSDIHIVGAYDVTSVLNILKRSGFKISIYDGFTDKLAPSNGKFRNLPVFYAIK